MEYPVKASRGILLPLGYRGENLARSIDFSMTIERWRKQYGDGVAQLLAQRQGDAAPYPVELEGAVWNIGEADNAAPGNGKCELVYTVDDVRVASEVWTTVTMQSLLGGTIDPPEPQESWVAQVLDAGAEAQKAAVSAESSKQAAVSAAEDAEDSRAAAETARNMAVTKAAAAELSASTAATAETGAETAKTAAETAQEAAETAQAASEAAQSAAESAQSAAEDARDEAVSIKEEMDAELAEEIPGIKEDIQQLQTTKVDKANGKGLSTNDYTTTEKDKLASLENYDDTDVVKYTEQTKTDSKKAQARENMNAAAPDGFYGDSGGVYQYSTNFLGKNTPSQAYDLVFRPTNSNFSGSDWVIDSISSNVATIDKIKGKTLVWNQLCGISSQASISKNGVTVTKNNDGTYTVVGTNTENTNIVFDIYSISKRLTPNHKFLISSGKKLNDLGVCLANYLSQTQTGNASSVIFTVPSTSTYGYLITRIYVVGNATVNDKVTPQVFDLTQMFGAGNEPTTVEEFKAMFPLDYYEYNEGELISLNATGLKTNGFNQWDEEWERGAYNQNTGEKVAAGDHRRSKNLIKVLPNTQYYINLMSFHLFYDCDGKFISIDRSGNLIFTTPSNACYMAFYQYTSYWTALSNKINLNIKWSGIRNGEYEPCWSNKLVLPINTYFPDGMNNVDTIYDELAKNKAIKRFTKISLDGTETYQNDSTTGVVRIVTGDSFYNNLTFAVSDRYNLSANETSVFAYGDWGYRPEGYIYVKDATYTTSESFKAFALAQYQAGTPIEFVVALAEPVETLISPELNLTYKVDDFGTEMLLPENTSGEVLTTPMDADIIYQIDYEANIRNNDQLNITKESMDNFISAFNASGLGTIVQTWDAANNKYTYTVTPPVQEA